MRKLKLQMQVSIDGYVGGQNSELNGWMPRNWDEELKNYINHLTLSVDCILLGRKIAEGFIPYWKAYAENPETTDDFGRKIADTPKVVFSKTLKKVDPTWEKTLLEKGDLVASVKKLKQQAGNDMIAYGGATFVTELIYHNLFDEYYFFVNAVALGSGLSIFTEKTNLKMINSKTFQCGLVLLQLEPRDR